MISFLSDSVNQLYHYKAHNNFDDYDCCVENLLYNWENVGKALRTRDKHLSYGEKYKIAESGFWGIINYGGKLLLKETSFLKYKVHLKDFKWYCTCDIENLYDKFVNEPNNSNVLLEATLKLTAVLDRSLGNLVLIKEKEVPFLIRDLLLNETLGEILGSSPVFFIQLLMGNVEGLNIRNVAWHGFFSKNELTTELVATLFLLIPSIGHVLLSKGHCLDDIIRRPPISKSILYKHASLLKATSLNARNYSDVFTEQINRFSYISGGQQDFWLHAFDLYKCGCFGDALIVLIPLMENMLRAIYCEINLCLPQKMTAETSEFYITLDVILEKHRDSKDNHIISLLGEHIVEMLQDLFTYCHGPRLRDKISHFEVDVQDIPEEIASHTFFLSLCIIQHLSPDTNCNENCATMIELITLPQRYESLFHPTSILKRQIYDILNTLTKWSDLPRPPEFECFHLWKNKTDFKLIELLVEILLKKYMSIDAFLKKILSDVAKLKFPTLFRPQKEIEIVNMFQRINASIEEIDRNVTISLKLRHDLWNARQMRSRQRENYARMLEYTIMVQVLLLCIIYLQYFIIRQFFELNELQISSFIKYFKIYLKYVENVSSLSQTNKNRWEEIKNLTNQCAKMCIDMTNTLKINCAK